MPFVDVPFVIYPEEMESSEPSAQGRDHSGGCASRAHGFRSSCTAVQEALLEAEDDASEQMRSNDHLFRPELRKGSYVTWRMVTKWKITKAGEAEH